MTLASASSRALGSLGVAIVTPFTHDLERIDHDALARVSEHLVNCGHDLIVANGTTGESPTTTDEEKHEVVRTIRAAVGDRVRILAGVGSNDTRHSCALARETAERGDADGLLLVTPYYNKPTQRGFIEHTLAVAEQTELPIMLYDIPGRAGIAVSLETAQELAQHPRIVALKEAKGDLHEGSTLISRTSLELYSGDDALNFAWLALGAVGVVSVSSHVTGRIDAAMIQAVQHGQWDRAQALHHARIPFVDAIMNQVPGTMAVKAALAHMGILPHARTRGPLSEVDEVTMQRISSALDSLDSVLDTHEIAPQ